MKDINETIKAVQNEKARSAWDRGVKEYALELLEELQENIEKGCWLEAFDNTHLLRKALLNGAESWEQYSCGGCALIYDSDIAERLCSPSELKRTDYGRLKPNRMEEWLDTQARALRQACILILRCSK